MKVIFAILALVIAALPACAQNVTVIGPAPQSGDCALFNSPNVIKTGGTPCSASSATAITALTGDGTATGPGSVPFTLATVLGTPGSFGSATLCVSLTVNAKGLITAISAATCTPALGSITGFGAGVGAALALATNASGALITAPPTRTGDIIYWNGSSWVTLAGNNSGTQFLQETSSGVPSWATAAGTVTSVTCGTGLSGGTFTTSGTCALALNSATLQASPANPATTTSATGVMMGLGSTCKITSVFSSRVIVSFQANVANSTATASIGVQMRFGTGTAPVNGAALTGTAVGSLLSPWSAVANAVTAVTTGGIITVTPGTATWLDVSMNASTGTSTMSNVSCNAMEF